MQYIVPFMAMKVTFLGKTQEGLMETRLKSIENEQIYKIFKHLFEELREKAKQTYYQVLLKDCHMEKNERNLRKV